MKTARRSTHHTVDIIRLALPIWIGQLAAIANPVLDTAMVSRYSVTDLGALAVGASVYISVYVALNGVMQSLAPTFGQLYGAGKFSEMGKEARQGGVARHFPVSGGFRSVMFSPTSPCNCRCLS